MDTIVSEYPSFQIIKQFVLEEDDTAGEENETNDNLKEDNCKTSHFKAFDALV